MVENGTLLDGFHDLGSKVEVEDFSLLSLAEDVELQKLQLRELKGKKNL